MATRSGAPAPDGAPGAEPAAEVPPEPVDSPQDGPAEAAAPPPPELEAVVLPDGPAPAAASDAPLDTATADPGEEEDTGLAEDTGAPGAGREGEAAAAELLDRLRLSLPGEGTAGAYVALATEAPMAFSAIGPVADGRRGRTQGLLVARTEVTQAQWTAVMGMDLGSTSGHWENPAEALSWCDALRFANTLSEREGLRAVYRLDDDCERGTEVRWDTRASGFRLLTEAEWLALAEASGPPPTPPPPTERGEQNNRGLGLVDAGRADERYGLAGVADNAREWVWGADAGPAEDPGPARWQAHDDDERRAIVRGCGTFSEVQPTGSDPWCRAELDGAVAPLGVGLRLARGQLPPEA